MSEETDCIFTIYHGGKFAKYGDGTVYYDGGSVIELATPAPTLFQSLPVSIYGQRVWYKLPYEDLSELKVLCQSFGNFGKMCEAALWTKAVEIYMEREDIGDEMGPDEGVEDQDEEQDNDQANGSNENNEGEAEMGEEEARIEKMVASFGDDEENDDYRRTPPTSDCEGEGKISYDRWRRGSGELKIRQVFVSVEEFREAVLEYALQGGYNLKFTRWAAKKREAKCSIKPCKWRIYCSWEESISMWMVKSFQEDHTCYKDQRCRLLSESIISDMYINDLRNDPDLTPKVMQDRIHDKYDVAPSHDQCRKAKRRALDMIQAEFDEQYTRIKDYRDEILETNPHSTVEVRTVADTEGKEVFDSFYMCFAGLRDTWKKYCRPIFGIDGCFLKSDTKGQLLAAVGRDSNNQIYPFAWAVVQVENTDSWLWFIRHLKKDLDLQNGDGFTLISDRQKGLLKAVSEELPEIEHRMCARHIYGNLRSKYPKKPRMKELFWEVVESFNKADYDANLKKLQEYDEDVFQAFMSRNPENCSRAFFKTTPCCEDALNNFSESYNKAIDQARAMPVVQSLETMRRQAMLRIKQRRVKTSKHKGLHSLKVGLVIAEEDKQVKYCRSIPGRDRVFEVDERGQSYTVNMRERTCKCRRWDLTGIPCRHALRVVFDNKKTFKTEELVSDWYLTSMWRDQYVGSIEPVNGMKFWKTSGETSIEAPEREPHKGRKRKPEKRMKAVNESPTKGKKVSQHGRTMRCTRCSMVGHYANKCPNDGVPLRPRKPRKPRQPKKSKKNDQAEVCDTVSCADEGPIPTQPSQI